MPDFSVEDQQGKEIKVGTKVSVNEYVGVVEKITEPDADYDDDLGRGVYYPPKVTVRFQDGEWDEFEAPIDRNFWASPEEEEMGVCVPHICDDVDVISDPTTPEERQAKHYGDTSGEFMGR